MLNLQTWICKRVKVDKDNSTIISGNGKKSEIEARCAQIKQQVVKQLLIMIEKNFKKD